jgi:hypothetical protein
MFFPYQQMQNLFDSAFWILRKNVMPKPIPKTGILGKPMYLYNTPEEL